MKDDHGVVHILLCVMKVTGSNPESETGYHHKRFLEVFFSHITYVDATLNQVISASVHVLPNPLPINHGVIRKLYKHRNG
jgi:hypothetical protein